MSEYIEAIRMKIQQLEQRQENQAIEISDLNKIIQQQKQNIIYLNTIMSDLCQTKR